MIDRTTVPPPADAQPLIKSSIADCKSKINHSVYPAESCLQHSHFELGHVRIQGRGFERLRDGLASLHRINNLVNPQASRAVSWVGLLLVGALG